MWVQVNKFFRHIVFDVDMCAAEIEIRCFNMDAWRFHGNVQALLTRSEGGNSLR
jgi:hypothetical protein